MSNVIAFPAAQAKETLGTLLNPESVVAYYNHYCASDPSRIKRFSVRMQQAIRAARILHELMGEISEELRDLEHVRGSMNRL